MAKQCFVAVVMIGWLVAGCATHVSVLPTHREDTSVQARPLAIAARNLEGTVHPAPDDAAQSEAARAVAAFNKEAQGFARASARWINEDYVDKQYEEMITAWVKVKKTFPNLKPDALAQDAYKRVEYEWEKLMRVTGYAGRAYQKKIEDGQK